MILNDINGSIFLKAQLNWIGHMLKTYYSGLIVFIKPKNYINAHLVFMDQVGPI